jgi:hypothetical protein
MEKSGVSTPLNHDVQVESERGANRSPLSLFTGTSTLMCRFVYCADTRMITYSFENHIIEGGRDAYMCSNFNPHAPVDCIFFNTSNRRE